MGVSGTALRALGWAAGLLLWGGLLLAAPRPAPVQVGPVVADDPLAAPLAAGPGETAVLGRVFRRFDADGDGRLSREELLRYVRDPSELALDADADGRISLGEFRGSFVAQRYPRKLTTASYLQSLLRTGREMSLAGWTGLALESYREAARDYPDCAEAQLGKARCLRALGRFREARLACERAVAVDPSLTEAWLDLALVAERSGDRAGGGHAMSVALARFEDSMSVAGEAGAIAARQVRGLLGGLRGELLESGVTAARLEILKTRAVSRARRERERRPLSSESAPVWQVAGLAASGQLVFALEAAELECGTGRGSWQLWLLRACLEGALGSPGAAAVSVEEAGRLEAERWLLAGVRLGNRLDLGERARAVRELEQLSPVPAQPGQYLEIGWQLAYRGEWGLALPWLERALGRWEASEELRVLLALCHRKAGHDLRAVRLLEQLASPPLLAPQWLELVAELLGDLGHPSRAIVAAREAVRQEPRRISARLELAGLLRRAGHEVYRSSVLLTGLLLSPVTDPLWPELAEAYVRTLPWCLADWLTTCARDWIEGRDAREPRESR